jgi:hypothetical protein
MPRSVSRVRNRKSGDDASGRILGTKAFAAISAVEGLRPSPASRRRLELLKTSALSGDERRAEVRRAYLEAGAKR